MIDDELNSYIEFDDDDFLQHRAALQYDLRCLVPDAPIAHNLMGIGNEVLEFAENEQGISEAEKLLEVFDSKLKIIPKVNLDFEEKLIQNNDFSSLTANFSRYAPVCIERCLNWKHLSLFIMIISFHAFSFVVDFICNFFSWTFLMSMIYVATQHKDFLIGLTKRFLVKGSPKDETSDVGRKLIMKAFQGGHDKVLDRKESEVGFNEMSTASDKTLASRAYIHGNLKRLKVPKPPPSLMSEKDLEVPVSEKRMYLDVTFNQVETVNTLLDLGATSCSINRSILDSIEKKLGYKLPRLKRTFPVISFAHDQPQQQECVVMNISVQNQHSETKNCPFLINEVNSKVVALLGINVLKYWGVDLSVGTDKSVLAFKQKLLDESKIQPSLNKISSNIVVPKNITIYPMEAKIIPAKIDGKIHPKFGDEYICFPEFGKDSGIVATPFLFKRRGDYIGISAQNISDFPLTLAADITIGEVSIMNKDTFTKDNTIHELTKKAFVFKNLPTINTNCICELRVDRSIPIIIFTDKYGISPHFHQLTAGDQELRQYGLMKAYRIDLNIIYIKPKNNSYAFDWPTLQQVIKGKKVRVLMSFRQELTHMEKRFLDQLIKKDIFIQIYSVKNNGCISCGSLANRDFPELFKDIDGFKVFIVQGKTQVPDFQRQKDIDSPCLELELGYYSHLICYRSQGKLIIFVHMTDWHYNTHRFRISSTIYTLFAHIRILGLPKSFAILTSWDDMKADESKQIINALKLVDPWIANPEFKIENLKTKSVIAPFLIRRCGCVSCRAIVEARNCQVKKAVMIFSGKLEDVSNTNRVREYDSEAQKDKLGVKLLEIFENFAESYDNMIKQENENGMAEDRQVHPDDKADWNGQEEIKESLERFPGEMDAQSIIKDRHIPKPWRTIIDESKFDYLKPDIKARLFSLLDRYQDILSSVKGAWRFMDTEPLDLDFTTNTPIITRPFPISPNKDRILTAKVQELIENDLVEILEYDKNYVTNISNMFLVSHNSECKREVMTGKRDPNKVEDIDPTKFRAVVDLREANATIKNPTQLNYVIESTTDLLNRMAPYKAFILIDIR